MTGIPDGVWIAGADMTALNGAARAALPHEACALLLGVRETAGVRITDVALSPNVTNGDPARSFEIDPSLHVRLQKAARTGGPALVGVWHSHPTGPARPSPDDRSRSVMGGWVWLITAIPAGDTGTDLETGAFWAMEEAPRDLRRLVLKVSA